MLFPKKKVGGRNRARSVRLLEKRELNTVCIHPRKHKDLHEKHVFTVADTIRNYTRCPSTYFGKKESPKMEQSFDVQMYELVPIIWPIIQNHPVTNRTKFVWGFKTDFGRADNN